MKDRECIFCKIVSGELPSYKIYEDDNFIAFMDISPASPGHTLIVTKNHYRNLYELPEKEAGEIMLLANKIALALKGALHMDGLNLLQNNGRDAGQTVEHFHLHLIPRYCGSADILQFKPGTMEGDKLMEIKDKIMSEMN